MSDIVIPPGNNTDVNTFTNKNPDELSLDETLNENIWRAEHEDILIEWADKAMCYRWMHSRAHTNYSFYNAWFTIPVIIMSTLTGATNFAQDKFPDMVRDYIPLIIGGVNIFAGIVTTIQQFLKITELNESYRVSSIAWDKFYRNIKIELTKHPNERIHAGQMLKICKEEFDRLMETSPGIPSKIINAFKSTFAKNSLEEIYQPEICDVLKSTERYRTLDRDDIDDSKEKDRQRRRVDLKRKTKKVKEYYNIFKQLHGRNPIWDELLDHFNNKLPEKELTHIYNQIEKEFQTEEEQGQNAPMIVRAN